MLLIYRYLINIFFPIIIILIFIRTKFNKEDKFRFKEKLFSSSFNVIRHKNKKLIWFHAASIGELMSIIPLIRKLNKDNKFQFLITTITLSSEKLINKHFSGEKNIIHRFFPIDKPSLIAKFLSKWSPNLIVFVDSEIWPNFLLEINKKKIPLILLNARITKKSFLRWNSITKIAEKVFKTFDLCIPSSEESKKYLEKLKVKKIKYFGNLKLTSENNQNTNSNKISFHKKFWCAVSIHKEEDGLCVQTHLLIKKNHKDIITVIIPRHIDRAKNIKALCDSLNLKSQIVSERDAIKDGSEVIIVNSYGVISNYLKNCKSVFIGKSLIKKLEKVGGQNPIEAAKLGCKIYHGPYVYNFTEIYELFNKYKIAEKILNENELAQKLNIDLNEPTKIKGDNLKIINDLGKKILDDTFNELNKFIGK